MAAGTLQMWGTPTREMTIAPKPVEISPSNFDKLFFTPFATSMYIKNTILINCFSYFTSKW